MRHTSYCPRISPALVGLILIGGALDCAPKEMATNTTMHDLGTSGTETVTSSLNPTSGDASMASTSDTNGPCGPLDEGIEYKTQCFTPPDTMGTGTGMSTTGGSGTETTMGGDVESGTSSGSEVFCAYFISNPPDFDLEDCSGLAEEEQHLVEYVGPYEDQERAQCCYDLKLRWHECC